MDSNARLTLSDWSARWLSWRRRRYPRSAVGDESVLRIWILPLLGIIQMRRLEAFHLRSWVARLDGSVAAGRISWSTALKHWHTLRAMLSEARTSKIDELRVLRRNPAEDVQGPDRGPAREGTFLWPSEFVKLISCTSIPLSRRRAYALAVYLYPRAGELAALTPDDVDLKRAMVKIQRSIGRAKGALPASTKTHANRLFLAERRVIQLLRAMLQERGAKLLPDKAWRRDSYARTLRQDLRRAGCTRSDLYANTPTQRPITGHDLRATGITWRVMRGDSLADIQESVGHRSIATTERYVRRGRALARTFGAEVFPALDVLLRRSEAPRWRVGLCCDCGRPAGRRARCAICRRARAASERQRQQHQRKLGLCRVCRVRAERRRRHCRRHLDYYAARSRAV